jgi:hypothetical protein
MLHEFVLYDKRTGKITGHFRTSTPDLLPKPPSPDLSQAPVTDDAHRKVIAALTRTERLVGSVHGDKIASLKLEPRFRGKLLLACDAPDLEGKGTAALVADGSSSTRITAKLVAPDGSALQDDATPVRFTVTRGTLSSRSATARGGAASVTLTSPAETVAGTVGAQAEGFEGAMLMLEFLPKHDFDELAKQAGKKS